MKILCVDLCEKNFPKCAEKTGTVFGTVFVANCEEIWKSRRIVITVKPYNKKGFLRITTT